ncbi:MAG TPA: hypothetical protein EYP68_02320 [Candidatus Korarchaeota archaeon]|nr:hypothetical protein [Candidatus Korarchaeota archaeon]
MYKREIPLLITFLSGMIAVLEYYVPVDVTKNAFTVLKNWGIVITAFALGFGAVNLFIVYGRRMRKAVSPIDRAYSIWLLVLLVITAVIGVSLGSESTRYRWIYNTVMLPLGATMYASLCFYMTAGAYKVLRARTLDSTLLLITALVVIIGNTPLFPAIWKGFFSWRKWIFDVIVSGSYRGIRIGVGIGSLVLGIRTLLGMETGYLGRR